MRQTDDGSAHNKTAWGRAEARHFAHTEVAGRVDLELSVAAEGVVLEGIDADELLVAEEEQLLVLRNGLAFLLESQDPGDSAAGNPKSRQAREFTHQSREMTLILIQARRQFKAENREMPGILIQNRRRIQNQVQRRGDTQHTPVTKLVCALVHQGAETLKELGRAGVVVQNELGQVVPANTHTHTQHEGDGET